MLGTTQKKKMGFFGGCIVPILVIVGLVAACYLFCLVIFLLNQAGIQPQQQGFILPL